MNEAAPKDVEMFDATPWRAKADGAASIVDEWLAFLGGLGIYNYAEGLGPVSLAHIEHLKKEFLKHRTRPDLVPQTWKHCQWCADGLAMPRSGCPYCAARNTAKG